MTGGDVAHGPVVGSVEDFNVWAKPHIASMRRYAAVLDPQREPDDVVQDALERAWRRWETFQPERGSARTWLLAIVADQARRRRLRRRRDLTNLDISSTDSTVSTDDTWSERIDVRAAVRRLPARQRQAVVLHYYVGLTVADAAAVMGCAEGTTKSALFDARRALATQLGGTR